VEWLFALYWAAAVDPMTCGPPPVSDQPADLDLDLVLIVYGVLVESGACGVCGAPLGPVTGVQRSRGLFTAARIVVSARCGGPRRHRHVARVVDDTGDLRMAPLRPA
jgi:hypothetical protein